MSIITLVLVLLIVGFLIYMLQTLPLPIHPWIKNLILGVVIIVFVIWLLNAFGINTGIPLRL
jgi:hypothetical protein